MKFPSYSSAANPIEHVINSVFIIKRHKASVSTSNATVRIPDQRFVIDPCKDSCGSDVVGGSQTKDPFQDAVRSRIQSRLPEAPINSPFARQSGKYHASAANGNRAEEAWKVAKPGPDRKGPSPTCSYNIQAGGTRLSR
jgi:hypothetical protein